jgi:transcription initiation factor TFIID subunit 5
MKRNEKRLLKGNENRVKKKREGETKKLKACIFHSRDQLGVFPTKHTPIYNLQFTDRNLCLVSGALTSKKQSFL